MTATIWNHSQWISETNPQKIKDYFEKTLKECGFDILDYVEHNFKPQGYTALWLLGESHFAVHTSPEFGRSYIELSSCNLPYYQEFLGLIENIKS